MTENNETKDAYEQLVDRCINAYRKLLNNGMALDVCRVQGKMRSIILKDQRYLTETRAIKAEQYLTELEQVEGIYNASTKMGMNFDDSYEGDDGRDGGPVDQKKVINAQKEALAMQLKAAQMRRDLMNLTAESADDKEEDAINFFFTALTADEMRKIRQVEINEGSEDESDAFKAMKKEEENDLASQALRRKEQTRETHGLSTENTSSDPKILSDGTEVYED